MSGSSDTGHGSHAVDVLKISFGYGETSSGLTCLTEPEEHGWDRDVIGEALTLAELDLQAAGNEDIKAAYRFWGEFRGHAVGLSFRKAAGRAGSYNVDLHAVPSTAGCRPPDPCALERGKWAALARGRHLRVIGRLEPAQRRQWLIQTIKVAIQRQSGCAVPSWRDSAEHAARLLSLFPWAIGKRFQIVSTGAATPFVESSYFDMSRSLEESDEQDLPDWVEDFLKLLEAGIARPDDFAEWLDWLDTQPAFTDLEGLFLAMQILLDPDPNVEPGIRRVANWIGQEAVPKHVRAELGKRAIHAFLVSGADDCVPYLAFCADAWQARDDGQGVVWELLDYLGSQMAAGEMARPGLRMLDVLQSLSRDGGRSGASRLVSALSQAFQGGAAVHEGAVEDWVKGLAKAQLEDEHSTIVKEQLISRIWSEVEESGFWRRRQLMKLRNGVDTPLGDHDVGAAMGIGEVALRRAVHAVPARRRPDTVNLLKMAVDQHPEKRQRAWAVNRVVNFIGASFGRAGGMEGVLAGFHQDDASARAVYPAIWTFLSREEHMAAGRRLQAGLTESLELKKLGRLLSQRFPPSWAEERSWWPVLLKLGALIVAIAVALGATVYREQAKTAWNWVSSQWSSSPADVPLPVKDGAPPAEGPSSGQGENEAGSVAAENNSGAGAQAAPQGAAGVQAPAGDPDKKTSPGTKSPKSPGAGPSSPPRRVGDKRQVPPKAKSTPRKSKERNQ